MNVVGRNCITRNIKLYRDEQVIDYEEFCGMINFWKMFLVEKYCVQAGERAFIVGVPGYHYYAACFAAWELGIVMVLDWPHCYNAEDLDSYKVAMFGTIDYIICTDDGYKDITNNPEYIWDKLRNERYGRHVIGIEDFLAYNIIDGTKYKEVSERIDCTPDSICVEYPSSGTTGSPKKITNTHNKIYVMSKRIARMFNWVANEPVLHTTNLNHGHGLCLHFLPAFMTTNEHYTMLPNNFGKLVKLINDKKATRLLLYTAKLLVDWLEQTPKVSHPVHILTLYQITPEIVRLLKEKNVASINSTFGDTAIGAGFLLKTVTQSTDLDTYSVANYGPVVDDFWQLDIRDGVLYAACKELQQDWMTSNDCFELVNNEYYFRGRADRYRINDVWIDLSQLEQQVRTLYNTDATIVVDFDMQKIYLALWDNVIEKDLPNIKIDYVLRDVKREEFFNSRKMDNSKIRDYCRTRLGLL